MLRQTPTTSRKASLASYLHKRPNSQHWQLRMMVPNAARPSLGRREFTQSLRTADRRLAESAAFPVLAAWQRAIDDAMNQHLAGSASDSVHEHKAVPSTMEIESAAMQIGYFIADQRFNDLIRDHARSGASSYDSLVDRVEKRRLEAIRQHHAGNQQFWIGCAQRHVSKRGWHLPNNSEGFRVFVNSLEMCAIDFFTSASAKLTGRISDYKPSEYVRTLFEKERGNGEGGRGCR
jgi:hypothetical protein